ncbi:hypothetical protein [Streptomyces sp. NPDC001759]
MADQARAAKTIEIEALVPLDSIDPIQIAEGYYLAPCLILAG